MKLIHLLYQQSQIFYGKIHALIGDWINLPPLVLRIRLTNKCSLLCDFCFHQPFLNQEEKSLSIEDWKNVLSKLPKHTVIDIAGAEPLEYPGFLPWLEMVLDYGFKVSLITNGIHLTSEMISTFIDKKLFQLLLNIDGTELTHNQLRKSENHFKLMIDSIKKIDERKSAKKSKFPHLGIKTLIQPENIHQLAEIEKMVSHLPVQSHSISLPFQNITRGGGKVFDNLEEFFEQEGNVQNSLETPEGLEEWLRKKIVKPSLPSAMAYLKAPAQFGVKSCEKPYSVLSLYGDGTVTACDLSLKLSHVRDLDFDLKKVWRTPQFKLVWQKLRRQKFPSACQGCNLARHTQKSLE